MVSLAWPQERFSRFVTALQQRFGDDVADVRHELFFLLARGPRLAGWRGCAAFLRDAWLLLRSPSSTVEIAPTAVILVATLAGESGWGTLARALGRVPARHAVILAHPRLRADIFPTDLPLVRPARPSWACMRGVVFTFAQAWVRYRSLLLASCLARRQLWRMSMSRTLEGCRGVRLLHNDFDLMGSAALNQGGATVCLQHGLPTDEFFPVRADWYVLWGATSHRAFIAAGCSEQRLVEDALGRDAGVPIPSAAPVGLSLLSQTHAPIFGGDLAAWLRQFAEELLELEPGLRILLHPQELQPYPGTAERVCTRPPHAEFGPGAEPRLVMGSCTSALFDAARAGHWVVRLAAPVSGNEAALAVLDVPLVVERVEEVLSLYDRLCNDPGFRQDVAQAQMTWLRESFSQAEGGLSALLTRLGCTANPVGAA